MEPLIVSTHTHNDDTQCCNHNTNLLEFITLKRIFIGCCLVALVFVPYFVLYPFHLAETGSTNGEIRLSSSYNNATTTKVILLWNSFFSDPTWNLYRNTGTFDISVDKKCIFTNVRDFLPSVENFNAIVFHTAVKFSDVPNMRNIMQKYIFANKEAPLNTHHKLRDEENFYNVTMTYRLDSDVPWPYSNIRDVETNALIAPTEQPFWRKPNVDNFVPDAKLKQLINGKKNSVAWFVSNCHTVSKREKLVEQLKIFLNVDVFGACGSLSCPYGTKECDEALDKHYKFYLSFENSLCIDYVTEKLFNALERTIVPIVFGGADYNRFAPPHSFIDVQDFKNVEELANYVKYLEKNTTAYSEYFWWKSYYKINYYDKNFPMVFQDLCRYLHEPSTNNQIQYYKNIEDYWLSASACKTKARINF